MFAPPWGKRRTAIATEQSREVKRRLLSGRQAAEVRVMEAEATQGEQSQIHVCAGGLVDERKAAACCLELLFGIRQTCISFTRERLAFRRSGENCRSGSLDL